MAYRISLVGFGSLHVSLNLCHLEQSKMAVAFVQISATALDSATVKDACELVCMHVNSVIGGGIGGGRELINN